MQPLEQLLEHVNQQRVKHIVKIYALDSIEAKDFHTCLEALLSLYPAPLIELALVETLVDGWAAVPMPRGLAFMAQVRDRLRYWETQRELDPIISTLTPQQFHHITGLDPAPIFGQSIPEEVAEQATSPQS
ncbi:MAG: hypothetical protein Fur0046_02980 [Cyanobacteria bacterium J069]|nr:MAG: hypothetical protein D6742_13795 [Cyanobacteria bacterium J069]